MADRPPLPELSEGLLDAATLGQLFDDIAACADGVEVRLKGAPRRRAQATTATLDEARHALLSGTVRGAQVRYWWDGRAWIDTLIRGPEGVCICRMAVTG
jgi:hypothetical protein